MWEEGTGLAVCSHPSTASLASFLDSEPATSDFLSEDEQTLCWPQLRATCPAGPSCTGAAGQPGSWPSGVHPTCSVCFEGGSWQPAATRGAGRRTPATNYPRPPSWPLKCEPDEIEFIESAHLLLRPGVFPTPGCFWTPSPPLLLPWHSDLRVNSHLNRLCDPTREWAMGHLHVQNTCSYNIHCYF